MELLMFLLDSLGRFDEGGNRVFGFDGVREVVVVFVSILKEELLQTFVVLEVGRERGNFSFGNAAV